MPISNYSLLLQKKTDNRRHKLRQKRSKEQHNRLPRQQSADSLTDHTKHRQSLALIRRLSDENEAQLQQCTKPGRAFPTPEQAMAERAAKIDLQEKSVFDFDYV